jgi:hypothetical protein
VLSWSAASAVADNTEIQLAAHRWLSQYLYDTALHIGTQFVKLAVCMPGMVSFRETSCLEWAFAESTVHCYAHCITFLVQIMFLGPRKSSSHMEDIQV